MTARMTRKSLARGNTSGLVRPDSTPAAPPMKPLAGYLRLTEDRDGNKIGYEVQREAIERWAQAYGYTIGEWYKDKDITAADRKVKRPDYERMLTDISIGKWSGIAVWRIDRLVRLTFEFERCNSLLEEVGAFIVSIDPPFDTRTEWGKFVMRLLVMLAEMEITSMKARARGHHLAKAIEGRHKGGGSRAFGFAGPEYDDDGNWLNRGRVGVEHVPEEAELIREAARRIAWEGESYADVIADWSTRNPPVVGSNRAIFQTTVLINTLTNPRMVGLRAHTTIDPKTKDAVTNLYDAEWEPILDRDTFDRLEAIRNVRPNVGRPHGFNLTGGLAVCGRCGKRLVGTRIMTGKGATAKKVPGYRCESSVSARLKGHCGKGSIIADPVEKMVIALISSRLKETPEGLKGIGDNNERESKITEALATIAECDRRLEHIKDQAGMPVQEGGLKPAEVPGYRLPWLKRRQKAVDRLETARAVQGVPTPLGKERESLWEWFCDLSLTQRRAFVQAHVSRVVIKPATTRGFFDKSRVVVTFADAQQGEGGGEDAGVGDPDRDALGGADIADH